MIHDKVTVFIFLDFKYKYAKILSVIILCCTMNVHYFTLFKCNN